MADEKITASRPVETLTVAVVGTGDASKLPSGTVAATPGLHEPDIVVSVVDPLVAILIRFANTFLTQLVGLLAAGMTPAGGRLLYTTDFFHMVLTCASLSLPGAGIGLMKDLITVFGRLEQRYPLLTGKV